MGLGPWGFESPRPHHISAQQESEFLALGHAPVQARGCGSAIVTGIIIAGTTCLDATAPPRHFPFILRALCSIGVLSISVLPINVPPVAILPIGALGPIAPGDGGRRIAIELLRTQAIGAMRGILLPFLSGGGGRDRQEQDGKDASHPRRLREGGFRPAE